LKNRSVSYGAVIGGTVGFSSGDARGAVVVAGTDVGILGVVEVGVDELVGAPIATVVGGLRLSAVEDAESFRPAVNTDAPTMVPATAKTLTTTAEARR
jgi:hypothetical protein